MKRILAALCALTMLFTFAACGDDPVEQSADNNGAAVGDSNDNNGGTPSDDGFAKVESVYDEALTGYFDLRILGLGERMVDIVPSCVWTAIERTPEEAARGAGTFITINWYNEVGTGDMSYVFTVDKVEEDAYRDSVKDALALRGVDVDINTLVSLAVTVKITGVDGSYTHHEPNLHAYEYDGKYYLLESIEQIEWCLTYAV